METRNRSEPVGGGRWAVAVAVAVGVGVGFGFGVPDVAGN
jgi:hypothetical protein